MVVILILLFIKINVLWDSIKLIFHNAFDLKSIGIGALLNTITIGIKRSLFSHEAGLGTMPSITGMSNAPNPNIQGFFGMLGVYVDTLLMCTITGIVIVQLNLDFSKFEGADLVIEVFRNNFGAFGSLLGSLFLFVFAFSSLLGQYYLGESNALLFTKFTKLSGKSIILIYQIVFIIGLLIGIYFNMQIVIGLVDIGLLLLGGTNMFVLFFLEKKDKIAKKVDLS
jgi:AGCS family alanine or glycine:cation symporter